MPTESLAEFELLVMLAALRLGPADAYTVSIADNIQNRTGRSVRRANVYTTLQRLEAQGFDQNPPRRCTAGTGWQTAQARDARTVGDEGPPLHHRGNQSNGRRP